MSNSFSASGFLGLELTSLSWLKDHFVAKLPDRTRHITTLPILPGNRLLDLGCGPGYFSEHFARLVGSTGIVHGVDKDPRLIDQAESRRPHILEGANLDYFCADFTEAVSVQEQLPLAEYDVITFFNSLCYSENPHDVVRSYRDILGQRGRILIKDSDFGHIVVTPQGDSLQERVLHAAEKASTQGFNNFLGRRLPELAQQIPHERLIIDVWSYPMTGPLSPEEKRYISGNLLTLLKQGRNYLNQEDRDQWRSRYDETNPSALIHERRFFFLMHEIVAIIEI